MALIAVDLDRALDQRRASGAPGRATARVMARGTGWRVADVICTSGPGDRRFEEQHEQVAIAFVVAGTFQYRSALGQALMTPGSVMLGSPGLCYECGHDHAAGDRCVSFWYRREVFDRIAADAGVRGARHAFPVARLPPLRDLAPLVARAVAGVLATNEMSWEELSVMVAARAAQVAHGVSTDGRDAAPFAEARIARLVRRIEHEADAPLTLQAMSGESGTSPFHFLRTFQHVTGVTPHQFVLRHRLRQAATRLAVEPSRVLDIALDCGFGDVSNFNRAFRAEFGESPRAYRRRLGRRERPGR